MSGRNVELVVTCRMCHQSRIIRVKEKDYAVYISSHRPHIQTIFPYLSPEERELLISNTCEDCWNSIFGGEDDE